MKSSRRRIMNLVGERALLHYQRIYETKTAIDAERSGEKVGMYWYMLDHRRRHRCQANMRLAFPEWTEEARRSTGKEVFRHFGRVAGDFVRGRARTNKEVLDSMVEIEGMEHLEEAEAM